jgi:hypothetical protein
LKFSVSPKPLFHELAVLNVGARQSGWATLQRPSHFVWQVMKSVVKSHVIRDRVS